MERKNDTFERALRGVRDPDLDRDVVSLGWVRELTAGEGRVRVSLSVPAAAEEALRDLEARAARALREAGAGEVSVEARVELPPAPTGVQNRLLPGVRNLLAVGSGKGGVGKSTVAVNLALALSRCGLSTGLLDADVYGPSAPRLLGATDARPLPGGESHRMKPPRAYGMPFISMGLLHEGDGAVIWRGPMASKLIQQFLANVEWGDLDVLVVDLPPGTGDVQLTLVQSAPLAGAVIVTTPQDLAESVTRRGLRMFETVQVPVVGVVENMDTFVCPHCSESTPVFRSGGGRRMARELGVPFLGGVPLDPEVAAAGDAGEPPAAVAPDSAAGRAYRVLARRAADELARVNRGAAATQHRPVEVDTRDPRVTRFKWDDGKETALSNRVWRGNCPCARCVDELTGERRVGPEAVHPDVTPVGVNPVGRYALHVQWSDGHGTGLYAFNLLRRLGETAGEPVA